MKMNMIMIIAVIVGAVLVISGGIYLALGASGAHDNKTAMVSGIVTDQNKVGVPGATVTIWKAQENSSIPEQYDNINIVDIPENSQTTNDGRSAAPGVFTFEKVPPGLYNITAEKDGHLWFVVREVRSDGTEIVSIVIPDYAYLPDQGNETTDPKYTGITGMVYDMNGMRVPGAIVTVYGQEHNTSGVKNNPQLSNNGTTAALGSFMFTGLPAGKYNVSAELGGHVVSVTVEGSDTYSPMVSLNLTDYVYAQPSVTPTPGSLSPAPTLGPWATLAGTVYGQDGLPVKNATVTLLAIGWDKSLKEVNLGNASVSSDPKQSASGNPQLSSDGTKSASGSYVFYKVPWGYYNVTAEKDGRLWSHTVLIGAGGQVGTVTCYIGVSDNGWGTISGIVNDANKAGIAGANVTLWNGTYDKATGKFANTEISKVKNNPQVSNVNDSAAAIGMYTFYVVPWGTYNLTVENNGTRIYEIVTLGPGGEMGTATHNPQFSSASAL